ncbi:hypothetical protein NLI96_g1918 [Meripilus lineatus]|uniref:F-box domain-containing protein n=1 Tax=Meripilus lineatus TaxID=2056292 RepID=A0AAD5VB51_9APHY|nr:hypothetical protein NLI96_g1918 [Physisporinus lineatus]
MMSLDDLPNELILLVIQQLPLPTLITSRRASRRWKQLTESAQLLYGRKDLLGLYFEAVHNQAFLQMRPALIPLLSRFGDRSRYLVSVQSEVASPLPQIFVTWVLEWPTRAAIGEFWPFWYALPPRGPDAPPGWRVGTSLLGARRIVKNVILGGEPIQDGVVSCRQTYDFQKEFCQHPNRATGLVTSFDDKFSIEMLIIAGHGSAQSFVGSVCTLTSQNRLHVGSGWVPFLKAELRRQESAIRNPSG